MQTVEKSRSRDTWLALRKEIVEYYDGNELLAEQSNPLPFALSKIEKLEARLKEVGEELPKIKPTHFDCEGDTWFGCPKSENGCADKRKGDKCNCGAEKALEVYGRIHAVATGKE